MHRRPDFHKNFLSKKSTLMRMDLYAPLLSVKFNTQFFLLYSKDISELEIWDIWGLKTTYNSAS